MKKIIGAVLFIITAVLSQTALAADRTAVDAAYSEAAAYVYKNTQAPTVGTVGGEWAIIGLSRGGAAVADGYYERYYNNVCAYLSEHNGILSNSKYTEYSRAILALTAIGKDVSNVGGYDLSAPLYDTAKVSAQGLNGPVWALIALDGGSHAVGSDTRESYIKSILGRQLPDGGWALSKTSSVSEADMTAMALTALSGCRGRSDVEAAIAKAVIYLSGTQNENGGFSGVAGANSETCAQVVTALCSLGIPLDDPRFIKNGNSAMDALLGYRIAGGGFAHLPGGEVNAMATEQALYALAAARRAYDGSCGIFSMNDELRERFIEIVSEMIE